jgi:tripartite-type tricarboxylate transporter receptor subunit TctC
MKTIIGILLGIISTAALAWPNQPITIVVPYPPGGVNDQIARFMQPDLESILKVPVVVENKPGAANAMAINYVLSKPNNDHTFIVSMDDFVVGPLYKDSKSYQEFKAINVVGTVPYLLYSGSTGSLANFKKQIKNNSTVNVGNNGVNSGSHLWTSNLTSTLKINSIFYKGSTPMITDVVAGHTEYGASSIASSYPMVKSGKLIPIMQSGSKRSATYPNVPTQRELGFKGATSTTWFAIFTKNNTSDIASKRFAEAARIIIANNPNIQEFKNTGMDISNLGYNESESFFKQEIQQFENNKR